MGVPLVFNCVGQSPSFFPEIAQKTRMLYKECTDFLEIFYQGSGVGEGFEADTLYNQNLNISHHELT